MTKNWYVLLTYSVSYFHQLVPFWIEEGEIALTGHPFGNPEIALWHRIERFLAWANISGFNNLNSTQGCGQKKNYNWGIVDHETITTEVLSMVKFTSNRYIYLAAFFPFPLHEREETKERVWLRQLPHFALYWLQPCYWCCFWYCHAYVACSLIKLLWNKLQWSLILNFWCDCLQQALTKQRF